MRYHYDIRGGYKKLKTKVDVFISIMSVGILGLGAAIIIPASAGAKSVHVVYDSIPSPQPGNVPSVGFEATSTSEFGGQVGLDGSERKNPVVSVLMSSWACKSGTWVDKNCITNPGSTFSHPVTLNVYNVNPDNTPGSLITSVTQTFEMPYRPTVDDGTFCSGSNAGKWWDGSNCNNGKAFTISFKLNGVTLPDEVVLGVAYNTSHHGYAPLGDSAACNSTPQGCPYDSLNVGTAPSPTVGNALPTEDDVYLNSTWAGNYCDGGLGTGTFRLDAGCWTGYIPAFRVEASKAKDDRGHHHHHRNKGHHYGWGKHDDHRRHHNVFED